MYDVITVGSSTLDIFAATAFSELITITDPKHEQNLLAFPSGSKILIDHLEHSIGGSGTNAGVALAKLGHKVGYLGRIGKDSTGEVIEKELLAENIDVLARLGKGHSGYSIVLETLEHDRTILTYKGINDQMDISHVPLRKLKTKWFYFGSMMGKSFETQEKLAVFAKKRNIKILFNPSNYLAQKGAKFIDVLMKHSTVLTLNREEACALVGICKIKDVVRKLSALGPKIIVVTDGKREVSVYDGKHLYSVKPPRTKVVDCTGAGDAFSSSFLSGIIKGKNVETCIKMGIANSTSIISAHGAKNHLLTTREMTTSLKKLKVKISKKAL